MYAWFNQVPGCFDHRISGSNQMILLSDYFESYLFIYFLVSLIKISRGPFSFGLFILVSYPR